MTVQEAIARSISHNEIVTIVADDMPEAAIRGLELKRLCEDWADAGDVAEFWGTDSEGNEWRVHLTVARA